ncbi:MAG: hypothetical protein ACPGYK_04375 [Flavobacteriales bacterium]
MRPSRPAAAFLILGFVGMLLGVTFKLNHYIGAEELFNIGVVLVVIGAAFWIFKLMRKNPS